MSRQWSNVKALVQCQGIGPMSRHWSNAKALVQCRGIGPMSRHWSNVEAMVPFWTVASSMFSFVFQSLISSVGDEEVIQSSDTKEVIQSSDAEEVIQLSDAEEVEVKSDGEDMHDSQQENQVNSLEYISRPPLVIYLVLFLTIVHRFDLHVLPVRFDLYISPFTAKAGKVESCHFLGVLISLH